ncbi:hypothetical protein FSARC_3509 [Fusarium sarcochroum]|uniref:Rhodopsin domain-containing protein n=1 Tax=Fusarium sarcochroum TaxID=1208366 RepID=A0A8H4XCK8_9HYPO|nr:hypothetical protein FSARC_3509 [Fusarium sarcochroum]
MDLNYDPNDNSERQQQFTVTIWVFTGLATAIVLTKLMTTVAIFRHPGWDDLMIFISIVCSIVACSTIQMCVDLGFGRNTAVVAAEPGGIQNMFKIIKLHWIGYPFGVMAYSLPNVAILILIERLAGQTEALSRNFLRIVVAIQIVMASTSIVIMFARCQPIQVLWDPKVTGTCWDDRVFNYSFYILACFTVFTDLVLAILPIRAFWLLQMKLQEKLEITFMLGLTFLSAIFTIVKAVYLFNFYQRADPDPLYNIVPLVTWGLIEQNVVIIAACVPTLKPLIRVIKDKVSVRSAVDYIKSGSGRGSSSKSGSGSGIDPKHNTSVSEIPLDSMQHQAPRRSQPSFEGSSGSEDWNEEPARARNKLKTADSKGL